MSTPESGAEVSVIHRATIVADELVEVRTQISSCFIKMGSLLQEAQANNYHRELGYSSFEAFIEDRLHMSYRKARYLADCVSVYVDQLRIPAAEIEELGWTRAKELIPVVRGGTVENAREWIAKARTMKTTEINLAVRKARAPEGQSEHLQAYDNLTLALFADERETIERAIELGKREGVTERAGRALMLICVDYIAEAEARQQDQLDNPRPPDHTL